MRYLYYTFEGEQVYIELDEESYAVRQLVIRSRNDFEISCVDDCLAEGCIDLGEEYTFFEENPSEKCRELSAEEFQVVWMKYLSIKGIPWDRQKENNPIGKQVSGIIKCFYPQGIIACSEDLVLCGDFETCQKNSDRSAMYPKHVLTGTVAGYDEDNRWILLCDCIAK